MPTGRPDYWYGTALYFVDTPSDGEVTRGPTSNWAFDHDADADAHHDAEINAQVVELGKTRGLAENQDYLFYSHTDANPTARIRRNANYNATWDFYQWGNTDIKFMGAAGTLLTIKNAGGIADCWDDTPTNGVVTKGVTSDWAFDHKANVAAHHAVYLDSDAVAAVKVIVDDAAVDGETDIPISSNWAFDHAADVDAHHTGFVDRGNLGGNDYDEGDLTEDGTWRELDISSKIPVGTQVVLFKVGIKYNAVNKHFYLRKNGYTTGVNAGWVPSGVADQWSAGDIIVGVDGDRKVEYYADAGPTSITLNIKGWWI